MPASRVVLFMLALAAGCAASGSARAGSPSPDADALLAFKSVISDPAAALASWMASSDPCAGTWRGVTCQQRSPSPPRVRRVVLEGLRLGGHAAALELLAGLPALASLSVKNNTFAGALHGVDMSRLAPHLKLLYLSGNGFSGRFPDSVLRLRHLRRLDLSGNRLSGAIPPEIGARLRALLTLDLARNSFVGPVPVSLETMAARLAELNVSGNHLEGPVPGRLAAAFPSSSFAGNPGLCGAPLPRRCSGPQQQIVYSNGSGGGSTAARGRTIHGRWMVVMIMSAVGAAVASLVAAALCAVLLLKNRKPTATRRPRGGGTASAGSAVAREETVRFDGCCVEFDVATLMQGAAEMLGKGATATTYRVVMRSSSSDDAGVEEEEAAQGETVVVKRMRRRQGASREDERRRRELAREMGTWRHANIVGLRAFYASAEELLLVFDYIPNGSFHSLLHENRGPARVPLDWQTRLKLAQDAAHGLAYLHSVFGGTLSHRHLTSSNILVDGSGNARVSDFALLQLLAPAPPGESQSLLQKQDVHGFGVILLEILTGRQHSPEEDGGGAQGQDLPRWARAAAARGGGGGEWAPEVFDVEMQRGRGAEDEMVALLQVALLCVAEEPAERPKMAVVAKMIEDIRDRGSKRSNKYSASPSQAGHSYESSPCVSEDTTRSTPASSS